MPRCQDTTISQLSFLTSLIHSTITRWYSINHTASLSPSSKFDHRQHHPQVVWQCLGISFLRQVAIASADKTLPLLYGPKLLHPVFPFVPLPYPEGSLGRDHDMWPTSFRVIVPVLCAFPCAPTLMDTLRAIYHLAAGVIIKPGSVRFKRVTASLLE